MQILLLCTSLLTYFLVLIQGLFVGLFFPCVSMSLSLNAADSQLLPLWVFFAFPDAPSTMWMNNINIYIWPQMV